MDIRHPTLGIGKKINLNKIQVFQNITIRKITNTLHFVSNMTLHKNLALKQLKKNQKCSAKFLY